MTVVPVVEDDEFDQFVEEEEVIYVMMGSKCQETMMVTFMTIWSMKE